MLKGTPHALNAFSISAWRMPLVLFLFIISSFLSLLIVARITFFPAYLVKIKTQYHTFSYTKVFLSRRFLPGSFPLRQ
jgi:hypothetical protein